MISGLWIDVDTATHTTRFASWLMRNAVGLPVDEMVATFDPETPISGDEMYEAMFTAPDIL